MNDLKCYVACSLLHLVVTDLYAICTFQLMSELVSNGVHIYQFPTDDETVADNNAAMNVSFCESYFKHF